MWRQSGTNDYFATVPRIIAYFEPTSFTRYGANEGPAAHLGLHSLVLRFDGKEDLVFVRESGPSAYPPGWCD